MAMVAQVPRYTAAEVRTFDDRRLRFEVIGGELLVSPAPGTPHQRAVGALHAILREYVRECGLGEAFVAPFEVELAEDTAVQPDVLVLLRGQAARLTRERLLGAPALVVEVISYSSKRTDRLQKRELYQAEGVAEYWIVDPELRRVERWTPGATAPEILTERVVWQPAAGTPRLEIGLPALFDEVWQGLEAPQG